MGPVETQDNSKSNISITDIKEEVYDQKPKEGASTVNKSDKPVEENIETKTSQESLAHIDSKLGDQKVEDTTSQNILENDNKVEAKESKSLLEESPNFSRVEGSIEPKADTYIKTAEVETQKEKDDDKIEDKTINESKTEAQKEKDNASQKVSENDNKTELKEHKSFHDESQNLSKNEGILGSKADFDSKPADLENQKKNDSNKLEEEIFTGKEDKQHEEAFVKSTNEQKDIRRES